MHYKCLRFCSPREINRSQTFLVLQYTICLQSAATDEKPLLADLDRTRKELEEARRKEVEQEANMRKVLAEKAKIEAELEALKGQITEVLR